MSSTMFLPLFVLFAAVSKASCYTTSQQNFVPGLLRTGSDYNEKICDGTRLTACADCNTIKICVYSDEAKDADNPRQACPAATPHCSVSPTGAVCQKTPDSSIEQCASAPANFSCTGVGFYPNPNSCQQYHHCSGVSAIPDTYDCPDGTRFSSKFVGCEQSAGPCPKICKPDSTESIFTAFPGNGQYYAYCWYDTTQTTPKLTNTFVFACGQGSTFDANLGRCVFKCPKSGLFANTANPKQYYSCVNLNGKLTYTEMACMANQEFNEDLKRCVISSSKSY